MSISLCTRAGNDVGVVPPPVTAPERVPMRFHGPPTGSDGRTERQVVDVARRVGIVDEHRVRLARVVAIGPVAGTERVEVDRVVVLVELAVAAVDDAERDLTEIARVAVVVLAQHGHARQGEHPQAVDRRGRVVVERREAAELGEAQLVEARPRHRDLDPAPADEHARVGNRQRRRARLGRLGAPALALVVIDETLAIHGLERIGVGRRGGASIAVRCPSCRSRR
jgi:hypothetical protein